MRILHLINSLALGGAERLLSELAPLQAAAGHRVELAALSGRGDFFGSRLEAAGLAVHRLSEGAIYDPRQIPRLRKLLREMRPEVLHVHLFPAQYVAALAAMHGLRPPVLLCTEHGAGNRRIGKPVFRLLDRAAYRAYDLRVAVGLETARALEAWTGLPFLVVENGVTLGRPRSRGGRAADGGLRIGVVGRLAPPKDPATLLRALALLPRSVSMTFVGEGELRAQMEALARELGLGERVSFLGLRKDVPALLEGFDLLAHASGSEGLPLSVLEAMSASLPCLLSDIPALREVGGTAALYFPNGDAAALAAQVRRIAAGPELAAELGRLARIQAERYDIGRTRDAYLALYAEVLSRKS